MKKSAKVEVNDMLKDTKKIHTKKNLDSTELDNFVEEKKKAGANFHVRDGLKKLGELLAAAESAVKVEKEEEPKAEEGSEKAGAGKDKKPASARGSAGRKKAAEKAAARSKKAQNGDGPDGGNGSTASPAQQAHAALPEKGKGGKGNPEKQKGKVGIVEPEVGTWRSPWRGRMLARRRASRLGRMVPWSRSRRRRRRRRSGGRTM